MIVKMETNIAEAHAKKTERRVTAGNATNASRVIENNRHYIVTTPTRKEGAAYEVQHEY